MIQGTFLHHKEIKAAQGIKITAQVYRMWKLLLLVFQNSFALGATFFTILLQLYFHSAFEKLLL